jgi:hypothetical protein
MPDLHADQMADERRRAMNRGMNSDPDRTAREGMGCFCILVLGAIMGLGVMKTAMLLISQRLRVDQPECWQAVLVWVAAPAAGLAFVAWFTYGLTNLRRRWKRD